MAEDFFGGFRGLTILAGAAFALSLLLAFAFEFINGFHDTANAVTTVIYTHTLKPRIAVIYSGVLNFFGVLAGGAAVAFSIVHLLPADLLAHPNTRGALAMTLSLLVAGLIWNLGTWFFGLPVSSSHTLVGSIIGVGIVNSLLRRGNLSGVNWDKALEVILALLISPAIGFALAAVLLWMAKAWLTDPELYVPPVGEKPPPRWIRGLLLLTCGGVSFAHGSNDGQKGMGLILLILIGFLPGYYAVNLHEKDGGAVRVYESAQRIRRAFERSRVSMTDNVERDLAAVETALKGKNQMSDVAVAGRWPLRSALGRLSRESEPSVLPPEVMAATVTDRQAMRGAVEYVPLWVVAGVALALGAGTMIGYQRIVTTVAEKIGKTHLSYAQGAVAEVTAMVTILAANAFALPVSTTHVLSSGVAGAMWANKNGVQAATVKRIATAWVLTLPMSMALSGGLYLPASQLFR